MLGYLNYMSDPGIFMKLIQFADIMHNVSQKKKKKRAQKDRKLSVKVLILQVGVLLGTHVWQRKLFL